MSTVRAASAALAVVAACAATTAGCRKPPSPAPSASTSAETGPPPSQLIAPDRSERIRRLLVAEMQRASARVSDEDLTSRDVVVRRHAARALARIADDKALDRLEKVLSDEDPETLSWAAYGLGFGCKGREAKVVRRLVARAASLSAESPPGGPPSRLDPTATLADALSRCGNAEAEATLRAWLTADERAEAAALALGRLVSRKKRLDDTSLVALLDAASRPEKPLTSALFAFSRMQGLAEAVEARLLEVAAERLADPPTDARVFAVRALGRAGPKAVEKLSAVVGATSYSPGEQADAARELAKLGEPGQEALRKSLASLEPKAESLGKLKESAWGPLITTLEALTAPVKDAKPVLERIASLEPPKDDPVLARRVITLRCRAAVLLAGSFPGHPKLVACDPDSAGTTGLLASLEVLGREALTGARLKRWKTLAESKNPLVRQAAIEMMASHPEITSPQEILARALRAPDAGTVAAAAQVISAYPDRAADKPKERPTAPDDKPDGGLTAITTPAQVTPHPKVVDALTTAFVLPRPADSIEVWSSLMAAAGALQLLSLKPKLDGFCKSDNPTLRGAAERALRLLGEARRTCSAAEPGKLPPELDAIPTGPVKLVFELDSGNVELTLEPELTPIAVARFVSLAKSGFFEKVVVHRVVPGFVVQLGDPGGDGYGGAGKEPLRCETSPVPFAPRSVGVALAGRDTGSSQLFVTLGPFPHLDGDYPLIGHAGEGWDRVARGDVVTKVRVVP